MAALPRLLKVKEVGPVTVVTFVARNILDELEVEEVGRQLESLLDRGGRINLVFNFGPLDRMTSLMVARLLGVAAKARAAGGRVVMCQVSEPLREVFTLLGLNKLIPAYATEDDAMQAFVGVRR
jgi:anti-anti-sigma factor